MSSLEISLIALACLVGGILLGMWLHYRLPNHHLSKESQDTVKLGAGMVATMSALVLGLLVSSAKSSFDTVKQGIEQNGARMIELDQLLAQYGPDADAARRQLKTGLGERIEQIWNRPTHGPAGIQAVEKSTAMLDLQASLRALKPQTDLQKNLLAQAQQISTGIGENRLFLIEQQQASLPAVFLGLLIFWLTLLFLSFGLFAPRNLTVFTVLLVCALSVSSAVFLILEMSHPLDGYIKASRAPLVKALEMIGH